MKKLALAAMLSLTAIAPAFAQSTTSDVGSDYKALGKDNADLASDRMEKAKAKADENYGKQALDSVDIGEKKAERKVDATILNQDKKDAAAGQ